MILFACVLFLACVAAWIVAGAAKPRARVFLRFACVLYAALAAAAIAGGGLLEATALLVFALGPPVLSLAVIAAFERAVPASISALVLSIAALAGIGAAASGLAFLSVAPLILAVAAMLWVALRRMKDAPGDALRAAIAALAILAASAAFLDDGGAALLLFSSVAMLGTGLALAGVSDVAVEQQRGRDLRGGSAIRHRS
jgi:hypothetical protein